MLAALRLLFFFRMSLPVFVGPCKKVVSQQKSMPSDPMM